MCSTCQQCIRLLTIVVVFSKADMKTRRAKMTRSSSKHSSGRAWVTAGQKQQPVNKRDEHHPSDLEKCLRTQSTTTPEFPSCPLTMDDIPALVRAVSEAMLSNTMRTSSTAGSRGTQPGSSTRSQTPANLQNNSQSESQYIGKNLGVNRCYFLVCKCDTVTQNWAHVGDASS